MPSVDIIVNLAVFYGYAPGLVIESGNHINRETVQRMIERDISADPAALNDFKVKGVSKEVALEFITGVGVALNYLFHSSKPISVARMIEWPYKGLADNFDNIADYIDRLDSPFMRSRTIGYFQDSPLTISGLYIKSADLKEFAREVKRRPEMKRPWNPIPELPIVRTSSKD